MDKSNCYESRLPLYDVLLEEDRVEVSTGQLDGPYIQRTKISKLLNVDALFCSIFDSTIGCKKIIL